MSDDYGIPEGRVVMTHSDGTTKLSFGEQGAGRSCGTCTLCCKLLPVPGAPLHKPAGRRCKHQTMSKGCGIYASRPLPCRVFACRWLCDSETEGMPRPDRAHYVIDMQDDYVEIIEEEGGPRRKVGVIQVWLDPAFPDAYKAPALRAYMLRQAQQYNIATIVRLSSHEAFTVFPPPIASDGQWHEKRDGRIVARDADDAEVLREAAIVTVDSSYLGDPPKPGEPDFRKHWSKQ